MSTYLFECSKEHLKLAKAEIETLLDTECFLDKEGVFIASVADPSFFSRLSLTKKVCRLVAQCDSSFENLSSSVIENTYKIDIVHLKDGPTAKEVADTLHRKFVGEKELRVDIVNPQHQYIVFWDDIVYFTELVWENTEDFESRRTHLLAKNHPTSMHPRLASALINIACKNSFCDPFCGSGGLVFEGKRMGLDVQASDISQDMISRAQENAVHLNLDIDFEVLDALALEGSFEAIVTDLPYGKASFVSDTKLYEKFFIHAKSLTKKMVVGLPNSVDIHSFLGEWNIEESFSVYIHKSLTRVFYVLV